MKHLLWLFLLPALCLNGADIGNVTLFPVTFQRNNYSITENYPYLVMVMPQGNRNALLAQPPDFVIDLPPQVRLIRACTRFVPQKDLPFREEKTDHDGKPLRRYRLEKIDFQHISIQENSNPWRCGFYLYLEADKGSAGLSAPVFYGFERAGKTIASGSFRLMVLPELQQPQHRFKKFRLSVTEFPCAGHPDTSIFQRKLEFWSSLTPKLFVTFGWEHFFHPKQSLDLFNRYCEFYYFTWATEHSTMILQDTDCDDLGFYVRNRLVRPGVPPFVDGSGKIDPQGICPQYLMKDPEGLFYGEYLRRAIAKVKKYAPSMNTFMIDYEPRATGGTCDNCLKDFAEFAKLSRVPSRSEISAGQPLNRKWQLYKIHQNKIIMNKIAEGVRKHYPGMKVSFCTTELRPAEAYLTSWDAVDVSAVDSITDFYSIMNYCSGVEYYDVLKYAMENAKHAEILPWIDPAEEAERFFVRYSPEKIRQNMIATIALRAPGLMFYPTDTLDGRYMTAITETAGLLAGLEEVYAGHDLSKELKFRAVNSRKLKLFDEKGNLKVVDYPNLTEKIRAHLHEKNGCYVLSVLNYSQEKAFLEVAIPSYQGNNSTAADLSGRKNYTGLTAENIRKGFLVEVEADGCAVIRISDRKENFPAVSQQALRNQLHDRQPIAAGDDSIYQFNQEGSRASQWRIFKDAIMLNLINGENYITVNPGRNGRIEEWTVGQYRPVGRPNGMLSEVQFYDPGQSESHEYRVKNIDLKGKVPSVTLTASIQADTEAGGDGNPLAGLLMEKRIELADNGSLRLYDQFTNPTEKTMKFGFRIKNTPYSVWETRHTPEVRVNGKVMPPDVYLREGVKLNWYWAAGAKTMTGDTNAILKAGRETWTFNFPKAAGLYFWSNSILHTVESLYREITLPPGGKFEVESILKYQVRQ